MAFDFRTHIRDPKTGELKVHQPYSMRIENGKAILIRGGKYFYEDGEPVPGQEPAPKVPVVDQSGYKVVSANAKAEAEKNPQVRQK